DFESRGPEAVIVGIVGIEHQLERAAGEADARDVDRFELELGLFEGQTAQRSAGDEQDGNGRQRSVTGAEHHIHPLGAFTTAQPSATSAPTARHRRYGYTVSTTAQGTLV